MTDYIDRQAAIEALGERPVVWDEWTDEYTLGQRKQYDYDKLAIEALPSAEVVPVKHGRWEEKTVSNCVIDEWQSARCSVCGRYHTTPYMYYFTGFKYCPNCGAVMEEQ